MKKILVVLIVLIVLLVGAIGVRFYFRGINSGAVKQEAQWPELPIESALTSRSLGIPPPVDEATRKQIFARTGMHVDDRRLAEQEQAYGLVVQLKNSSDKTLPLKITLINPTFGKTNVFQQIISPTNVLEIGRNEGWVGASGDLIQIESNGYQPKRAHLN